MAFDSSRTPAPEPAPPLDLRSFARAFVGARSMIPPALLGALSTLSDAVLLGGIRVGVVLLGAGEEGVPFAGRVWETTWETCLLLCGVLVASVAARFALGVLRWRSVTRHAALFERDVRTALMESPVPRGSEQKAAQRFTHDVGYLRRGGEHLHQFVLSLLQLAVFVPWMAVLSWELAFGMLVVLAPVVALLQRRLHRMGTPMDQAMARSSSLGRDFGDWLRLRKNWTLLAPVFALKKTLLAETEELAELSWKIESRRAWLVGAAELVSGLATLAVLVGSGALLKAGRLDVADLVAFCGALLLCYRPLREAFRLPPVLRDAQIAWDRLRALASSPEPAPRVPCDNGRLRAHRLSFSYAARELFRDAEWTLDLSRPVMLQGANGAGKSTLLKLVAGLVQPRSGEILLPGNAMGTDIAYMAQEPVLPAGCTFAPRDAEERALVDALRLPESKSRADGVLVSSFSGGELQRLALAAVLLQAQSLVLLDEPVARMPMADRAPVLEAVRLFCENRGLMLLVASHDAAPGFGIARIEDLLGGGRPESADGEP